MKRGFLTRIAYANGLWIVGLLLLLLSAIGNLFFLHSAEIQGFTSYNFPESFGNQFALIFQNTYLNQGFRFFLLLGSALLLQLISSEFRLIRVRSFFPFFLFCIFSAAILPALSLNGATVSSFFFCWSCLRLFAAVEAESTNRAAFDASVLLALSALFQSRVLFLLPVFWMVLGIMQRFNLKSFLASLMGALCIFWIIGGLSFLFEDYSFLQNFSKDLISFELVDFTNFSAAKIAYTSFLGLLMISAMVSFWPKQHLDKLRTRNYLNSVLLLWFALLALWLFSGSNMGFSLLLFGLSALMAAHFFSLIDTIYSRFMFFLFLLLSLLVYFLF